MWYTLAMVLLVLWLLAIGFFHVGGNAVHLLVVGAIAVASPVIGPRRKAVY